MRLKQKAFIGIAIAWAGIVGIYSYATIKKDLNNYALIRITENGKNFDDNFTTKDSCRTTVVMYGADEDGIRSLDLNVNGTNYLQKSLNENTTEYLLMTEMCHPRLPIGESNLELIITDINGDTKRSEAKLTVEAWREFI